MQIHRQAEDGAVDRGLDLVVVRHHVAVAIDVLPHPFIVGVEDVWAISMHQHTRLVALGVAVAAHMISGIKDMANMTCFGELTSYDRPRESSASDTYRCHVSSVTTWASGGEVASPVVENDHELAARLAELAGELLIAVRAELSEADSHCPQGRR